MVFLFQALVLGAAVMHLGMFFHTMQLTVALFVLGMIVSLVIEGFHLTDHDRLGVFGHSYEMWMTIDPHLLLFTLLPALLAGDAMTIDTAVAKRVAYQCIYLAGPGVLVSAVLAALFLKAYLGWSFLLSLVAGSILCATDPVAVVALLKELGASPVLTVQIQGESLLNDGTAIVLFSVAYDMLSGKSYDWIDMTMFLVQVAFMAVALGMFTGYFFFSWIRLASNKLNHHSGVIQIVLTVCCAYWSFVCAEGVFEISGVLSTVASSLVLAHHMWPHVVSQASMHHVWHTIESVGNVVVFFLAGALTGNVMGRARIPAMDYLHLVVIYLVLLLIRGVLIFASRPLLSRLNVGKQSPPVSLGEAAVMTWGGLRGAVGMALAMRVFRERAVGTDEHGHDAYNISQQDGERVLFFVSGVAFLTIVVNAVTAPAVVRLLGVTALPQAQQRLLRLLHKRLVLLSASDGNPEQVTAGLKEMLKDVGHEIDECQVEGQAEPDDGLAAGQRTASRQNIRDQLGGSAELQDNRELAAELRGLEREYGKLPRRDLELLGPLPEGCLLGQVNDMIDMVANNNVSDAMAQVVTAAFLRLVQANYWKQIEAGDLRPGSPECNVLMVSIQVALSPLKGDLKDFAYIDEHVRSYSQKCRKWWKVFPEGADRSAEGQPGTLSKLVASSVFNLGFGAAIVLNGVTVALEEWLHSPDDGQPELLWIFLEGFFTALFLIEALLKLGAMGMCYFRDGANSFDFTLVCLGIFGFILSVQAYHAMEDDASSMTGVIRLARVFRVLRFLRVFRLFHAFVGMEQVSYDVVEHMHKITVLMCFVNAHVISQQELVKYFGGNGVVDDGEQEGELARCILQSQASCYRAIQMAVQEVQQMDPDIMTELNFVHMRKEITEDLEHLVMGAHKDGAISATEAESILGPIHTEIRSCLRQLYETNEGRLAALQRSAREHSQRAPSTGGSAQPLGQPAREASGLPGGAAEPQLLSVSIRGAPA